MGLDMYLSAKRSFDKDSPQATKILAAAETNLDALSNHEDGGMYLPRWEWYDVDVRQRSEEVERLAGLLPFATDSSCGGDLTLVDGRVEVSITAAYWRKSNAIHAWFVDECQDGVDECQPSAVRLEQLAYLRTLAAAAAAAYINGDRAKAAAILSPRAGFFFGSTDVDDWFAADLRNTIDQIDHIFQVASDLDGPVEFVYQSSW